MLKVLFLQVWLFLLELKCPSSVEHDWHKIVTEIVTDFLKILPCDIRVRLFLELEANFATPHFVIDILMTEATTALDELVLKKVRNYTVDMLIIIMVSVVAWSLYSQYN